MGWETQGPWGDVGEQWSRGTELLCVYRAGNGAYSLSSKMLEKP